MYKIGLTGGYDYSKLKEIVLSNPELEDEYNLLMKICELCILENLTEPNSGKIKKFSREYWQDQWNRSRR